MRSDLEIRVGVKEDINELTKLWSDFLDSEKRWGNKKDSSWAFSEKGQKEIRDVLTTNHMLVAVLDDRLVGFLVFMECYYERRLFITLEKVFVLEDKRGQGIALRLLEVLLARYREAVGIQTGVFEKNIRGIRFYNKNKFQKVGAYPYEGQKVIKLRKLLSERKNA